MNIKNTRHFAKLRKCSVYSNIKQFWILQHFYLSVRSTGSFTITSQQEYVCVQMFAFMLLQTFPDFQSLNEWGIPSCILSMKAKKICKPVIPVLEPTQDGWWFGGCRAWFCGHILLSPDAEVTHDRTAAHGTSVQLAETTGTDAGMPTWQESS